MGQPQRKKEKVVELSGPPIMQGQLKTISLGDVLQLLAGRGERLLVLIHLPDGVGRVFLEGENLFHVEIAGSQYEEGLSALRKLISLKDGRFEVRLPIRWPEEGNLIGPVQALLLEALRQEDEASFKETFFNEDLFEKALEFDPPEVTEREELKPSLLERVSKKFSEADNLILLDKQGEVIEERGESKSEELAGIVSYAVFHLQEIGNLLSLGELSGFALAKKNKLIGAVSLDENIIALKVPFKKGLLWWSKKLIELRKELVQ
ncbi:hypothetical protein Thein_0242 [Thermodesulfatator indicus DSM 15286]|uniref:PatA-like N-terminal domain-containing protein n=1 Tax=Thermodesulfatator indicus (strain DSM 15286 / JCM 11887 / CIR29812) TaxID=667014 RepID=F8A9I0_THEID|nr:DUF4388 domain-containing protein [Thermodesulfatator indicus]AEH44127.1 hypothetical protein Thein_0242 [Thermodesulfatator indicus DSM 15286]